jgi:hypothetical protein
MSDYDGGENFEECPWAGIEGGVDGDRWSPLMYIFLLIGDEAGEDGIYPASLKRLALRTGMDIAGVNDAVMRLVELGALEVLPNKGLKVALEEDELSRRLFG